MLLERVEVNHPQLIAKAGCRLDDAVLDHSLFAMIDKVSQNTLCDDEQGGPKAEQSAGLTRSAMPSMTLKHRRISAKLQEDTHAGLDAIVIAGLEGPADEEAERPGRL